MAEEKPKATENLAKDVEIKGRRKELAAKLGELTIEISKLTQELRAKQQKGSQIATEMEALGNGK